MNSNAQTAQDVIATGPAGNVVPFNARPVGGSSNRPPPQEEVLESLLQETVDMLIRFQTVLRLARSQQRSCRRST